MAELAGASVLEAWVGALWEVAAVLAVVLEEALGCLGTLEEASEGLGASEEASGGLGASEETFGGLEASAVAVVASWVLTRRPPCRTSITAWLPTWTRCRS